jgi:hypothetical protein
MSENTGVSSVSALSESQARANYEAYVAKYQDELERTSPGRVALLHNRELVEIYNDWNDAYKVGCKDFGLGEFSLQKIGAEPAHFSSLFLTGVS